MRGRRKPFDRDAWRRKLIRETEAALWLGLSDPRFATRIPSLEVGTGAFHPDFAEQFWREALELDENQIARLQGRSTESQRQINAEWGRYSLVP